MARFLVTGGAGFIGSALVHRLVEAGEQVRVVDNFSTGFKRNLGGVLDRVELVEADLVDPSVADNAVRGVEFVLHQAAIPSVQFSIDNPLASHRSNVVGTLNLLVAAQKFAIKRFVYASSCAVYGDSEAMPKVETMPENPISPYALGKLMGEKYCGLFHKIHSLETVCLRYFNVFGPRQDPDSPYSAVISRFIRAALNGERPLVYGDGEQSRDFVHVDNVVNANLLACTSEGVAGMVFNIGTGERHSLNALLSALSSILGDDLKPRFEPARAGDIRHSGADITKAQQCLGYKPTVNFAVGLQKTVQWYKENAGLS
jgi:nucleoside-diphosphate-sugar epimerase